MGSRVSSTIGVGVIGLGDGGMSNLRSLMMFPGVRVVALYDLDPAKYSAVAQELSLGPEFYRPDVESLVLDPAVDLVVVATPDDQHLPPLRAALNAGKYVFLEKPVATSMNDLAEIRVLAGGFPDRIHFGEKYSHARPVKAALACRDALGPFMFGCTLYSMWRCDRIMGGGKWRTESRYNPCAGGLSHNFMTALLFAGATIRRIRATGQVLTYHENLDNHGGYDTMEGALEFANGRRLSWLICLAVRGDGSPLAHRTIAHTFQFECGTLAYGPTPEGDRLIVDGKAVSFSPEPSFEEWAGYNIGELYRGMHADILAAIRGEGKPRHTIKDGINVAAACIAAFQSAQEGGGWVQVPFS